MKNIWLISKYASHERYAKTPARLFYLAKEFKKAGNNVLLVTSDANHFSHFPNTKKTYNDEEDDGVSIRWIKTKKYHRTASVRRVLSWLDFERKLFTMKLKKMSKPDIVIVSSLSILSIVYGYYLKKRFNAFLVFEIRDIWPLTMTEEGGFSKWHPLVVFIGIIEKFGYKKADLIVGTMPNLKEHVTQIIKKKKTVFCSPLGFEPKNYSTHDTEEEEEEEENPFKKYLKPNRIIVGYAGSIGITNALEPFIDTIKKMSSLSNIHFLIVGSGDLKKSFQKQLDGYENVTFLDRIPQNKVKQFLSICDILYLSTKPSKVWDYGQSMNKVVEYMLAAKPIVATYTGYPSMIDEAKCGVFVNSNKPEDIKNTFLHFVNMSQDERKQIGEKGRRWIFENRTYEKLAKEYLNCIFNLM